MISVVLIRSVEVPEADLADYRKAAVATLFVVIGALCIYGVLAWAFMNIYSDYPDAFARNQVDFERTTSNPSVLMYATIYTIRQIFLGLWEPLGRIGHAYYYALVICCFSLLWVVRYGVKRMMLVALLFAFLIAIPSLTVLMEGQIEPLRTYLAAPLPITVALLMLWKRPRWKFGGAVLLVLCFVQGLYVNSLYQARASIVQRHDTELALALNREIERAAPEASGEVITIYLSGKRGIETPYPDLWSTAGGYSLFEWDGGVAARMVKFLNL